MSKSIGEAIRERREAAGLSQVDLGKLIKTNPQVINRIEQGARSDPRWSTVARLAAALGCSLDLLAAETGFAAMQRGTADHIENVDSAIADVERLRTTLLKLRSAQPG